MALVGYRGDEGCAETIMAFGSLGDRDHSFRWTGQARRHQANLLHARKCYHLSRVDICVPIPLEHQADPCRPRQSPQRLQEAGCR